MNEVHDHLQAATEEVILAARAYVTEHLAETDADEKLGALASAIDALDAAENETVPGTGPTEEPPA